MQTVSRSEWGARPPRYVNHVSWQRGGVLWVHHSAGAAPPADRAAEAAEVRRTQTFHMDDPKRRYSDIGYGWLVAPYSGRIYEGRGYGVRAAHCPGHNSEPSVCVLGNWSAEPPPPVAIAAVDAIRESLGMTRLRGHRDGWPTSCPGDGLYRALRTAGQLAEDVAGDLAKLGPPNGATLRLVLEAAGHPRREWAGWAEVGPALRWISRNGIRPDTKAAIAWDGNVWRGPRDVRNVAINLSRRYLEV